MMTGTIIKNIYLVMLCWSLSAMRFFSVSFTKLKDIIRSDQPKNVMMNRKFGPLGLWNC